MRASPRERIACRLVGRLDILIVAAAGVVLGHGLAFAFPHADGHAHDAVHGYLDAVVPIVAPLALLAAARIVLAGARRGARPKLGLVVLLQTALFSAQEAFEALAVGHGLAGLVGEPALWLGLAIQVLLGVFVTFVLRLATKVRFLPRRPPTAALLTGRGLARAFDLLSHSSFAGVAFRRRGPPVATAS